MTSELRDYPSIDIMNHILEIRRDLAGNPFEFREFQIMLQTTFKAMTKPRNPATGGGKGGGSGKKGDAQTSTSLLSGHGSVAECLEDMDALGYTHISVCATKMWSYYYHHKHIMDYPTEPVGEAGAGRRDIASARFTDKCRYAFLDQDAFKLTDSIFRRRAIGQLGARIQPNQIHFALQPCQQFG